MSIPEHVAISVAFAPQTANHGAREKAVASSGGSKTDPVAGRVDSDRVSLSPEGRQASGATPEDEPSPARETGATDSSSETSYSRQEQLELMQLKSRDREVRNHEQAHLAAAGQYAAGGPSFSYQVGPDGNRYAVGGEVPVDVSNGSTPEETIQKMERVRAAALAPAEPSAADRQIAAQASMKAAQARQELMLERQSAPESNTASDPLSAPAKDAGPDAPSSSRSRTGNSAEIMIRTYQQMQGLQ